MHTESCVYLCVWYDCVTALHLVGLRCYMHVCVMNCRVYYYIIPSVVVDIFTHAWTLVWLEFHTCRYNLQYIHRVCFHTCTLGM